LGDAQVLRSLVVYGVVGTLISLDDHRRRRAAGRATDLPAPPAEPVPVVRAPQPVRVEFAFDLADPLTYLAAERVERGFAAVTWRPVPRDLMEVGPPDAAHVEARAEALRMPLVWPEHEGLWTGCVRPAMRIAGFAAERGLAAPFVVAAGRLAYCGGFALDHPDVLAEAAAAAGLPIDDALAASADEARDEAMAAAARDLLADGADALPALRVGGRVFAGEERLPEAVLAARAAVPAARAG
jgi:2-hydroxychromene-2-carboxylate isomerase